MFTHPGSPQPHHSPQRLISFNHTNYPGLPLFLVLGQNLSVRRISGDLDTVTRGFLLAFVTLTLTVMSPSHSGCFWQRYWAALFFWFFSLMSPPPSHLGGPPKKNSGRQREEGHGVFHHVQWEHHPSYLLQHYQNASIQDRQIQYNTQEHK